ncbi:heme oxygenase (biliverdin-producing) [Pseudonocardia benzenivorans]|uniref:Heme oxygenase n=2 Tax=Pseudonocardia TaxID=1847 RepID=F4D1U5_PSEUX|nr:biliverdin-producing heme oxygenase [Pseudonocardia dioxanivorans]AEA28005.1 Heme oxygenase [Pseudonocardia dioxanivorans CB1190]GJF06303.1 biliverdin-producing heme oxygenase [Pseudonocardia sp. D17]
MTSDSAEPVTLARRLREGTAAVHDRAHGSRFMSALLGGELPVEDYAALAGQLWHVYDALERAGDALADEPAAAPFRREELRRAPALAADLHHLLGAGWPAECTPLPATRTYVAALRTIAADRWVGGWVAHHYTRYLGDLAGGQVVRALLRTRYGLVDDGARFYAFDAIPSVPAFRKQYRAALDATPFDEAEQRRVVDEAVRAFDLNIALLDELDPLTGDDRIPA